MKKSAGWRTKLWVCTAAAPDVAEQIYLRFVAELEKTLPVQTGRFGADMQVSLVNDGPVTFMLER